MQLTRRDLCLAVALLLSLSGCKKERPVPPGPGGLPPLSGQAASDPASLVHPPHGAGEGMAMPPDHPPVLQGAEPAAEAPDTEEEGGAISGVLELSPKLKDKVKAGTTIFIMARAVREGGGSGPVVAAERLKAGTWPLPFSLSGATMPGTRFAGRMLITARVDQDGDAMTKQPGDVEGVGPTVAVGTTGVKLTLDTVRTEAPGGNAPPPARP